MEPPSMIEAMPSPMPLLTLATKRVAVVKSGSFKLKVTESPCADLRGHGTFHGGAIRNAARTRHIHGELRAVGALDAKAADDEISLRDRIDLSVESMQGRDQQRSAAQTLGIGDRVHGDVDGLPGFDERRQHRVHRDRGHVFQLRRDIRPAP